jgi:hypothetical protein
LKTNYVAIFTENRLEQLERSKAYLVADIIFNWIGGVGELLLLAYAIRWWHRYAEGLGFDPKFSFSMKVLLLSAVLISVKDVKNYLLAWVGIAPPDYEKCFGPKQLDVGSPHMRLILDAQQRAARIRERGIRVHQLLAENEAAFLEKLGKQR